MNLYISLIIEALVFFILITVLLWIILVRSRSQRIWNPRDSSMTHEELAILAKKTAISHSVSNKKTLLNWPLPRMNDNYDYIYSIYRELNNDLEAKRTVPDAAEWLMDNFYIIEEEVKGMRRDLNKREYAKLPILKQGPLKGHARIYALAMEMISSTDAKIDEQAMLSYLSAYQSHSILFDREIWALPIVMRLALIEHIRQLCENVKATQLQWRKADKIVDLFLASQGVETVRRMKIFEESLIDMDEINPSFIEHLFYRLRRSGWSYPMVLTAMDEHLKMHGTTTESVTQKEHNAQSVTTISIGNLITNLKYISSLDWSELFSTASIVEETLNLDPDGTYPLMDQPTRNRYRGKVEKLAQLYNVSEIHIAREAIELAKSGLSQSLLTDDRAPFFSRTGHVGYYLIGDGQNTLERRQGKRKKPIPRSVKLVKNYPGFLYLSFIALLTLILMGTALQYAQMATSHLTGSMAALIILVLLIPSSEISLDIVNWVVCRGLNPTVLPRMEFKDGIPADLRTIVVIPSILPDEARIDELLRTLERHYLSNRDPNLFFALLGAYKDSDDASINDNTKIIDFAISRVLALNKRYPSEAGADRFYFFHRESQYNAKNNKWFGWERKRGALLEFNDLILGSKETSFVYSSNSKLAFEDVKYIITLDSDTQLPIGMAKRMIATMAHPLNRPIIDPVKGVVVSGYGIMQPRIDFDIESSNKSLFSRIFTGQEGLDPYARAISDVYQDLFGEGIFTGKGIYDLSVFQSVLKGAIPENTVLSHDLLEGSYLRTALVTDLKFVDAYPTTCNSYFARLHRWVRGDWQLLMLLFKNPLSLLSRWKIVDNMRRSLIMPALLVLIFLGLFILPGRSLFWLVYAFIPVAFPLMNGILDSILSIRFGRGRTKGYLPAISGLKATLLQVSIQAAFLPYQAYLMLNAVSVTLFRVLVTQKNTLEWVTSADAERSQKNTFGNYLVKMFFVFPIVVFMVGLSILFKPATLIFTIILGFIWLFSPFLAYKLSREILEDRYVLSENDREELRKTARKTWRYFEEFANYRNNFLAPDNYQEDPPRGIATRTSPTNIGLGLMATMTARDFGFIGTLEMVNLLSDTITSIEKLGKWNGHLYNWYDTLTLLPFRPIYISSVDSGNFVGYLITLTQGLRDYLNKPLLDVQFVDGILDTLKCSGQAGPDLIAKLNFPNFHVDDEALDPVLWKNIMVKLMAADQFATLKKSNWRVKIEHMLNMFAYELNDYMPWIDFLSAVPPDFRGQDSHDGSSSGIGFIIEQLKKPTPLKELPSLYRYLIVKIDRLLNEEEKDPAIQSHLRSDWLFALKETLIQSIITTEERIAFHVSLMGRIDNLSKAADFKPLYSEKKQLFSIGYNLDQKKLTDSYYDLLASEARQTSFISIARNEVSSDHWERLGRPLTVMDGYKGLVSWTGSMFEYLMPLILMKSYKNTLLDETYAFAVRSQKKYGNLRGMPWGTSESAFNSMDIHYDYQYKAMGVPWLGLKRGLLEDSVAAPYATLLSLHVDPKAAIENIHYLQNEGLYGHYGFYEAADYTPERLAFDSKRAIVKSYMAHHQGMSLLSLNNYLNANILQKRFFANPEMNSARLLLQEKVPNNLLIIKENKEKVKILKTEPFKDRMIPRVFKTLNRELPKVHILSNGNYSVMLTDKGTGYSKNKMTAVTRWREDAVLDQYGMFFYIRNLNTNALCSAAYAPLNVLPEQYKVIFNADKAIYRRTDGLLQTTMEVAVASGDNSELRRISIKNNGDVACEIEIMSYFEVLLTSLSADKAHPAFSNLFIETQFDPDRNCIIANRRPRSEMEKGLWLGHSAVLPGGSIGSLEYETDRMKFIGRGHTLKSPIAIENMKPLSNTTGPVLDPMMSLKYRISIGAGRTVQVSFVSVVSETNESLSALLDKYATPAAIEGAFQLALTRSHVENRYLNIGATKLQLYQDMMSNLLFLSPVRRIHQDKMLLNKRGQSSLWAYGISGDLPIVLVVINKTTEVDILYDILKAHEYWRIKGLKVDLVILSNEDNSYTLPVYSLISDIVMAKQTHDLVNRPGDVFILDKNKVPMEDVQLLYSVARIHLNGDSGSIEDQMETKLNVRLPKLRSYSNKPKKFAPAVIKEKRLLFFNGIGGFSLSGDEYVIRLEKQQTTPAPWINVISNPNFGFFVSESGSSTTWCKNSRENKLSPWSNDPVQDYSGEAIYIGDLSTGELWTPTPLPIRERQPYSIQHGFGYTTISHNSHGVEQELTQFVPVDASIKISILKLKNTSSNKRDLAITYYVRPVLGVSDQDTAMHIRSNQIDTGTLTFENSYNEDYPDQIAYMDFSLPKKTLTCDRNEFFGVGGLENPDGLLREKLSGAIGAGLDPCGAIQSICTLKSEETLEVILIFGRADHAEDIPPAVEKYLNIKIAKEALKEVRKFWREKIDVAQVNTPSDSMNLMLNGWLQYQIISARLWGRTAFYQSGGAYGFRDQLQDCLSVAHIWPELSREQILRHGRHQFIEGDVQHWWHEPSGKGTRTRFKDDRLWLPYIVSAYIDLTGDDAILNEQLPFIEDALLSDGEDERYGMPKVSQVSASLYDHCLKAIDISLSFGSHGLPLMGSGDWNDGMNTVGNKGRGESVWLGWFLCAVLKKFSTLCINRGFDDLAANYLITRTQLMSSIEQNAWDGSWYRRAYFDTGLPLGSIENSSCKIDSISQSWSVISESGTEERSKLALQSAEDYLVNRDDGLIKLLTPPFESGSMEPGYIKGYVPGVRENGGQYTHAAAWLIIAFAKLGKGDKALELFDLINPINHARSPRDCMTYKVEPYVMAADVYSVHPHAGRGGWTWYTGAAGWYYKAGLESILGFKKKGANVVMDPCIPNKWTTYSITYHYMDTPYEIKVHNPDGLSRGVLKVTVDGIEFEGNAFNLVNDGIKHHVSVLMGK